MMSECSVCGAELSITGEVEIGELVTCDECGCDMEVTSIDPIEVQEAPQADEDWGE